jgi:hypothetical protein
MSALRRRTARSRPARRGASRSTWPLVAAALARRCCHQQSRQVSRRRLVPAFPRRAASSAPRAARQRAPRRRRRARAGSSPRSARVTHGRGAHAVAAAAAAACAGGDRSGAGVPRWHRPAQPLARRGVAHGERRRELSWRKCTGSEGLVVPWALKLQMMTSADVRSCARPSSVREAQRRPRAARRDIGACVQTPLLRCAAPAPRAARCHAFARRVRHLASRGPDTHFTLHGCVHLRAAPAAALSLSCRRRGVRCVAWCAAIEPQAAQPSARGVLSWRRRLRRRRHSVTARPRSATSATHRRRILHAHRADAARGCGRRPRSGRWRQQRHRGSAAPWRR